MNPKLRSNIDSLLDECDKLAEKRCDEYMEVYGNPENKGVIRDAARSIEEGKTTEFFDEHERKVKLNIGEE
tara:strand:- start:2987 stop:3199 length:213 start_codon:yes stop_codon:yes gene_type:complete